jgi:hypothetical protein
MLAALGPMLALRGAGLGAPLGPDIMRKPRWRSVVQWFFPRMLLVEGSSEAESLGWMERDGEERADVKM